MMTNLLIYCIIQIENKGIFIMKILICDDEPVILDQIESLLNSFENKNKIKFQIEKKESGKFILTNPVKYDVAFIDIEMPNMNGLILSKRLKLLNPDIIIIVITSFQNYLDDAMKIHVFRYLSKPIDKNRFFNNFKDALEEYRLISKYVIATFNNEVHRIKTKDILFIENQKYGSIIHSKYGDYQSNKKPKQWAKDIDQDSFVFSHNSILVNLQNVVDFNNYVAVLRKNEQETVTTYISQRKYSSFKKAFFDFAGGIK